MSEHYESLEDVSIDDLMHYGIEGMRWGVRRFQNEDGSYTAAGKARRGIGGGTKISVSVKKKSGSSSGSSRKSKKKEVNYSDDYKNAHTRRDTREMTNDELRRKNDRLNLERNYKNLTKKQESEGERYVKQLVSSAGTAVFAAVVTNRLSRGAADATSGTWDKARKAAKTGAAWFKKAAKSGAGKAAKKATQAAWKHRKYSTGWKTAGGAAKRAAQSARLIKGPVEATSTALRVIK